VKVELAKRKIGVTVDEELIKWVQEQIKKKRFASLSHAVEYALYHLMEEEKKEK